MVRLVGWKELAVPLPVLERSQEVIHRHVKHIEQMAGEAVDASVHVKRVTKSGTVHRYEVYLSLLVGNRLFHSRTGDWDLVSAVHKSFASIEHQTEAKYTRERVYDKTMFFAEPPIKT